MRRRWNAKGIAPLKPELDRIAAVKDKGALIEEIAHLHLIGPNPLFNFYSSSDLHNADQVIAYIDQGGLSLPDRDYYIKDDADKVEMRKHLAEYVTQVFTLAGQTPQQAASSAQTVLHGRNPAGGELDGPHQDARSEELATTR